VIQLLVNIQFADVQVTNLLKSYGYWIGFLIVVALGFGLHLNRTWNSLGLFVLDNQFSLLREHPQPLVNDVVLVSMKHPLSNFSNPLRYGTHI
jgi:hypothetical protein